jgi:hypothetical protein
MGAEFIYAVAEMPPVPTIDGKGLYHDDAAKQVIFDRLRDVFLSDLDLTARFLDEHDYTIMDENAALMTDGVIDWDDKALIETCAKDVADAMAQELREWWRGDYDRQWSFLSTFNAKGERIVLSIAGEQSWGDAPDACEILWRFNELPSGWWKDA